MKKQNYQNHIRYYPPHHFVFYPVILAGVVFSIIQAFRHTEAAAAWYSMAALFLIAGWLGFMLRQHYSLTNQDRIVRLEVRFRYFTLTGKRFELLEEKLSLSQVLALRFAADEELPALANRAIAEKLSADAIKRAVSNWQADYMRV